MKLFNDNKLFLAFLVTAALAALPTCAHAACTMPDGAPDAAAGDIVYNTDHNVMQYCDGTNWVGMGGGGGMEPLPDGQIWIGNPSDAATPRTLSGDATLSNTGVLTIENNAITSGKVADNAITSSKIEDDAVTPEKIPDSAITLDKLSTSGTPDATTLLRGDGHWTPGLPIGCDAGDVAEWDGAAWICTAGGGGGGGGGEVCGGEEPTYTNSPWTACSAPSPSCNQTTYGQQSNQCIRDCDGVVVDCSFCSQPCNKSCSKKGKSCGDADEADGDMIWLKALDPAIRKQIDTNKSQGRL